MIETPNHHSTTSSHIQRLITMAPTAIDTETQVPIHPKVKEAAAETTTTTVTPRREPLKLSGALDSYEQFDSTPIIGREFPKANLVEWLEAPNSEELIRDLAITSTPPVLHPSHRRTFC
jgi:hypothetical protein